MNILKCTIASLLVLTIFGCGEIRHRTNIYAIPQENWSASEGETVFGKSGIIESVNDEQKIKIVAVPYIQEKEAVGPLIPIIPTPIGTDPPDDVILMHVEASNKIESNRINLSYLLSGNEKITPSEIESFEKSYKLYFEYRKLKSKEFSFVIPANEESEEVRVNFLTDGDTSYRILPPKGMFQ